MLSGDLYQSALSGESLQLISEVKAVWVSLLTAFSDRHALDAVCFWPERTIV